MPFHFDYLPVQPYQDRLATSIAPLIGASDRAQAASDLASGQAWGQGVQKVGSEVGATLNNLMAIKLQQQSPAHMLDLMKVKELQDQERDDYAIRGALQRNGGDPDQAANDLERSGTVGYKAVGALRTQGAAKRKEDLEAASKGLVDMKNRGELLSQTLPEPPKAPEDPTDVDATNKYQTDLHIFQKKYVDAYPQAAKILGPDATHLPHPDDPELVARVGTLRDAGMSAAEKARIQELGLAHAREAITADADYRKAYSDWTKAAATTLSVAESQEEWDATRQGILKSAGSGPGQKAAQNALAMFPAEWSQENATKARQLGMTANEQQKADEPPKLGTVEDAITTWANDHKRPIETLTLKEKETAARSWVQSQHIDPAGSVDNPAQRASVIKAVLQFPSVYRDLDPSLKGKVAGDLAAQGFTFPEKEGTTREAATAERALLSEWHTADKDLFNEQISKAQYDEIIAREYASYQAQGGRRTLADIKGKTGAAAPAPSQGVAVMDTPKPVAAPVPQAPPAGGMAIDLQKQTKTVKVGDIVTIGGVKRKITKMYPNGKFDADTVGQ